MGTTITNQPVEATTQDQQALERLVSLLGQDNASLRIVNTQGAQVDLPQPVITLLRDIARALAQRQIVSIVPLNRELTTQQAADLLNVSRPYLIKLLEQGEIPYTKTGTHRRIAYEAVMRYKVKRDAERRQALDELIRLNQELGLYDL